MRPLCSCHGVEMRRNTDKRLREGFYWRCKVRDHEQGHAYYFDRMPFSVRARRGLRQRRAKALERRRERQEMTNG